ncbi:MAG: hypothetical protein ACK415_05215 [Thermodesulfovibrionales bacterium]
MIEKWCLLNTLEGSSVFMMIKKEIDSFIEKYDVVRWLPVSQASTIHEILMTGDKDEIIERLNEYKQLQLKRTSEKDKWQKEVDGKKAIEYFCEMIFRLFDNYSLSIKEEVKDKFGLGINDSYYPLIYQNLIKIFDYIFVIEIRVLKDKEVASCLKG